MNEEQLYNITGGAITTSGTFINALMKMANTMLEIGRAIGSGIRYATSKRTC